MKRKFYLGAFLSILISTIGFAQGNLGMDYFYTKEYAAAKSFFEDQLNKSQSPAEAYYYLGEIAYAEGDMNGAKANFEKGLAADPNYMENNVGLGKLLIKSNPKEAEDMISSAAKKNKKDVGPWVAAAYAYLDNGMKDKALEKLTEAKKADKNNPYIYLCEGDIYYTIDKSVGEAATQYTQAAYFDKKFAAAYIKLAQVYESTGAAGTSTAIEELNKAIEVNPDYFPAYRYLGRMYYHSGNYSKTIETYKKVFEGGGSLSEDYINYIGSLYFTGQNDEAKTTLAQALAKHPNDFFLNRLNMYVLTDTEDYTNGLAAAQKFFSLPLGKAKYLANDYLKYGTTLAHNDQKEEAIVQLKKAIELDPTNPSIYKEVASASSEAGRPDEAATYYKKYIELAKPEAIGSIDYFYLGRYYYTAGSAVTRKATTVDSLSVTPEMMSKAQNELKEADNAFAKVVELSPESYLGSLWRARVNSALDMSSEKGLAKPYYEATIAAITKANGSDVSKNTSELRESYSYLSYYSFLQYEKTKSDSDKAQIKINSEKLLSIDPENSTAKQLLDYVK